MIVFKIVIYIFKKYYFFFLLFGVGHEVAVSLKYAVGVKIKCETHREDKN